MNGALAVVRAMDELRRGRPVVVTAAATPLALLSVELADEQSLAEFCGGRGCDLLISRERGAVLGVAPAPSAADAGPVRFERVEGVGLARSLAIADATLAPGDGPLAGLQAHVEAEPLAAAAVRLAKLAGLLPALFVARTRRADWLAADAESVMAYRSADGLRLAAEARLPIAGAEDARVVAFRETSGREHLALWVGTPGATPLVRLHSACVTGDVLGSLKCDCGPQLRGAVRQMAAAGGGVLLYLQQEGRGIGLVNKLRAYQLQDQGLDTVDANLRLGFAIDERDFGLAAAMLGLLGVGAVRLMTNNPAKIAALRAAGISVVERVPHAMGRNPHNEGYLATKRSRTGHLP